MERLTMTSDKGRVAFTFDLDITCEKSEIEKILKLAEKLKEYEDLEEQGKLLKLPCAVGDNIYIVLHNRQIQESKVVKFKMIAKGWAAKTDDRVYLFDEFGKTVFLTKSEAETALQKIKEVDAE